MLLCGVRGLMFLVVDDLVCFPGGFGIWLPC